MGALIGRARFVAIALFALAIGAVAASRIAAAQVRHPSPGGPRGGPPFGTLTACQSCEVGCTSTYDTCLAGVPKRCPDGNVNCARARAACLALLQESDRCA